MRDGGSEGPDGFHVLTTRCSSLRHFDTPDVDRQSPNNWLDDAFWIKVAYHSWRVPLPINSNWWILMADDLGIPEQVRQSVPPKGLSTSV